MSINPPAARQICAEGCAWVHHHEADSPIWIPRCSICRRYNVADITEQIEAILAERLAQLAECSEDAFAIGDQDHHGGCPCRKTGPHRVHRCQHGTEWWQHEDDQSKLDRIAEMEQQRDAILALCERKEGDPCGSCAYAGVYVDDIRAIYAGTAPCSCALINVTTIGAKPEYVRGKPNGCPIHTGAEERQARQKARESMTLPAGQPPCVVTIDGSDYVADLKTNHEPSGRYTWSLQAHADLSRSVGKVVDVVISSGSKVRHGRAYVAEVSHDSARIPPSITRFLSASPLEVRSDET